MGAVPIRGDWVGQVVDHRFPLLEWLGGSAGNGVFVTELAGAGSKKAAIKLIRASPQAEDRLAIWRSAATLSHPHLLQIIQFGRAEIDDTKMIYVVTDLAEEVLSQIIPERPLSESETREMLLPVLDALNHLHGNGFVHTHLKPSNVLVVGNEIKLSSDSVLPIGKLAPELRHNDIYVAPEMANRPAARVADIWSLGITVVEALTQEPPIWDPASCAEPVVPTSVPEPFQAIARESLHVDASRRCTLHDIRLMLDGHLKPAELQTPHQQQRLANKSIPARIPWLPLIIGLLLVIAIIIGVQIQSHNSHMGPVQTENSQQAPPAQSKSPDQYPAAPSATTGTTKGEVLTRSAPDVPHQASNTIHGTVVVVVRASVDTDGEVTRAELASHGPSAYFARLALESARTWKFRPPRRFGRSVPSTWLLHYAFRSGGVDVRSEETTP
jgi:TonB family protein